MSLLIPTFRISLRQSMRFLPKTIRTISVSQFHDIAKPNYSIPKTGTRTQWNNYCSKPNLGEVTIAYYDEIKSLPNHPEILLIDVREPEELKQTGKIPTSINIPLNDVRKALSKETSNDMFKKSYGKSKPQLKTSIIFSCKSGKRASKGLQIAQDLGYVNLKLYKGSWDDWVEHEHLPK